MKTRLVTAAIIKKGDHYLLGKKVLDRGPYPNTWVILGGGINAEEETIEEAIRRELREEAGIEVKNLKKVSFYDDYEPDKFGEMTHYIFLIYEVEYASGEVKPNDDIVELQWFTRSELQHVVLARPSIQLFKELHLI